MGDIERVDTKIMMNLANPEQAYSLQFIPNDGVGLVRMEFIVSNHIRVHPMALLRPDKLQQVLSLFLSPPPSPRRKVDVVAFDGGPARARGDREADQAV